MTPVAPVMPTIRRIWPILNPITQIPKSNPNIATVKVGVWAVGFGISFKAIIDSVFRRQTSGSVICTSCGVLVGVNDDSCYNCGRSNPGLWGYAPALRALGRDLGFVPFVIGTCAVIYALTLSYTVFILDQPVGMRGLFSLLAPSIEASFVFGASGTVPVFGYRRWW